MTDKPKPFDASDPFDAMSESFRLQVCNMAIKAGETTIYRDLDPGRQLECFLAGTLVGVVGVCFAHIGRDGRAFMMEYIVHDCLPVARAMAEAMMEKVAADTAGRDND
jgi:hypothetical protein